MEVTAPPSSPGTGRRGGYRSLYWKIFVTFLTVVLLSAGAGLLFKGSGFYATDYRSAGYAKQKKDESKPCGGSDPKAPCGSCAKPS